MFSALFKNDENDEQKLKNFSQLTPIGKRVIILVTVPSGNFGGF